MMHALGNAHSECHFAQNVRSLPRCSRRDIAPWFNRFLLWLLLPTWSSCSRSFASSYTYVQCLSSVDKTILCKMR
jgi:hypothetical protein